MKTAIYLRQSLDRDRNQLAIDRQREDILKLCASKKGWDDPIEYCDDNISAKNGSQRPAWDELCRDIRDGIIGRLAVWDDDRLRRTVRDGEDFIDLADEHHVKLANVGGDIDLSTAQGRMFFRMKGTIASYEIEHKSARQKRANRQRAMAGKPWVSRSFGYTMKIDREKAEAKGKIWDPITDATDNEIVAHEAEAIRKASHAVLNGATLWSIAKQWNAQGVRTSKGFTWTGGTVKQVLIRPRNAGLQVYDGEILDGVKTAWKPIVPRDVWEGVCAVLADPKRFTGKSPGRKHKLSGIAICGECGRRMGTTVRKTKGGNRPVYQCKHMGCMKIVRDLARTDERVIESITKRLAKPDAAKAFARPTVDVAALNAEADALHTRIAETKEEYNEGLINARDRNARLERLEVKLAAVNDKRLPAHMSADVKKLAGNPKARELFDALPLDRQRGVIDTVAAVTVHRQEKQGGRFDPKAITVDWK